MKITVVKSDFTHKCFDLLRQVVSVKKSDRDIYTNITMKAISENLVMECFSLHGSIRVTNCNLQSIEEVGSVCLPFKSIADLLKPIDKNSILKLNTVAAGLQIKALTEVSESLKATLSVYSDTFSPLEIEEGESVCAHTVPVEDIKQVLLLAEKNDYSFRFRGIFFKDKYIFAGSGNMLAILETGLKVNGDYSVDPNCIDVISSLDSMKIELRDKACLISNEDSSVQYYARYLQTKPPPIEPYLSSIFFSPIAINKSELVSAAKRALVMVTSRDRNGTIKFEGNKGTISNTCAGKGASESYFKCETRISEPFSISLGVEDLMRAAEAIQSDTLILQTDGRGRVIKLSSGTFQVIIALATM